MPLVTQLPILTCAMRVMFWTGLRTLEADGYLLSCTTEGWQLHDDFLRVWAAAGVDLLPEWHGADDGEILSIASMSHYHLA